MQAWCVLKKAVKKRSPHPSLFPKDGAHSGDSRRTESRSFPPDPSKLFGYFADARMNTSSRAFLARSSPSNLLEGNT